MLTISWLINLHLDWQLRRYSKSSSDLVISAKKAHRVPLIKRSSQTSLGNQSLSFCEATSYVERYETIISPALEEIDIVELAELEGELEGGL